MLRVLIPFLVVLVAACSRPQGPQRSSAITAPPNPAKDTERAIALKKAEDVLTGESYKTRDGAAEARADIAAGAPKWKVVGLTRKDHQIREQLFQERFGVKMEVVAGCSVSTYLSNYVHSYNRVMSDFIAGRFGKDAIAAAEDDAWTRFQSDETEANQSAQTTPVSAPR